MEQLFRQLRDLPKALGDLPAVARWGALVALLVAISASVAISGSSGDRYQYAFTNLATEESAEVAATLKGAGVPFRLEAGGAAVAVPADKVYDARLILAAAGLPRGAGAGFELFDRGDLGISEFTQKVNLRRALEGELARTIGHLGNVRSARIHLTLGEKGLYRDEESRASAAVVLQLQPGRSVGEREISGIRHLVASAVPGLQPDNVTIVDGRGSALSSQSMWGEAEAFRQREMERSLEQRLITLLEPVVGAGAVVARVSAILDGTEVATNKEVIDPQTVLRTEHKATQSAQQGSGQGSAQDLSQGGVGVGGVAGAAANQPVVPGPAAGQGAGSSSSSQSKSTSTTVDESRNFEVGRTTTRTVNKGYRVTRLSVALLIDGVDGRPRPEDELEQLGELARKAVGFDAARGDQLEIRSSVFTKSTEAELAPAPAGFKLPGPPWAPPVAAVLAFIVLVVLALRLGRRGAAGTAPQLRAGARVALLEAELAGVAEPIPMAKPGAPPDPNLTVRERARELVTTDPARAALLLRAWITADEVKGG